MIYNSKKWTDIRNQADKEERKRLSFLPESRVDKRRDEASTWNKWFIYRPYFATVSARISLFVNHKLLACSLCDNAKEESTGMLVTGSFDDMKQQVIQSAVQCGVAFMDANSMLIMTLGFGEQIDAISDMFAHASSIQPVILYIDNLDTFLPRRWLYDYHAEVRINSCLDHLHNQSGAISPPGVFVVGVTNVPVNVDPRIVELLHQINI
jgi:hypothetical protein